MKHTIVLTILAVASLSATAQIVKCKDAKGQTVIVESSVGCGNLKPVSVTQEVPVSANQQLQAKAVQERYQRMGDAIDQKKMAEAHAWRQEEEQRKAIEQQKEAKRLAWLQEVRRQQEENQRRLDQQQILNAIYQANRSRTCTRNGLGGFVCD